MRKKEKSIFDLTLKKRKTATEGIEPAIISFLYPVR